jgi:hypothetical protein
VERTQRPGAVGDGLNLHLVQRAGHLLAIARDEGDRRAAVEQLQCARDLPRLDAKLTGERTSEGFGVERLSDSDLIEGDGV